MAELNPKAAVPWAAEEPLSNLTFVSKARRLVVGGACEGASVTRLKKPLLLLLLLLTAAELNGQSARAAGERALPGSNANGKNGVKLCGREFIRAVIFVCGGSRWKRLTGSAPPPYNQYAQSNSDKEMEDIKLQSVLNPELEYLQHIGQPFGQQLLKVQFNLYGDYNARVPTSDNFREDICQIENAVQQSRSGPGLVKKMKSNNFPWVSSPRRKRDFSMGVAKMCCKWGCTQTEVSTLC
uniref:relaxin-3-like n=1 Tax=Euleptes europaea TaxID=460621 RepID=UPI002542122C|nr:relaxin-3-like [Euleptes europaea]